MIKLLRFLVRVLLISIAIPSGAIMGAFWLLIWIPAILLSFGVLALINFAYKRDLDCNPLPPILWFFWTFVMLNPEKGDKYL